MDQFPAKLFINQFPVAIEYSSSDPTEDAVEQKVTLHLIGAIPNVVDHTNPLHQETSGNYTLEIGAIPNVVDNTNPLHLETSGNYTLVIGWTPNAVDHTNPLHQETTAL